MPSSRNRCGWVNLSNTQYVEYHDSEWGEPVRDDVKLFEMLTLEGAQAGLSWETVLKKREGYRQAFDKFDVERIAKYRESKIERLLGNPGIIRNRLKVRSVVTNARAFLAVQEEFGTFSSFVWSFVDGSPLVNLPATREDVPATTSRSDALSRALNQRGFKFVGSTICYAFM
ncbi:MAG: DNA-3-methyladenine glycosylase I, partial [Rhodothermales bacterium]|nr:DNA-3-methyladenine glycosylase I [Rhodothermales bacterium]